MSIHRSRKRTTAAMANASPAAVRWLAALVLAASVLLAPIAQAATRAWLDRSAAAQGEAVTLNIETDQPGVAPDYTPLQADFELGPPYRGTGADNRTLFGVALTPRRGGALQVPALQVGGERTAPLALRVTAARAPAAVPGGDVFVEMRVDDPAPYVQQSVGLTLRLYYATPLLSGELAQDAPEGASLQRVGDDVQSSREIGGRRYHLVERRYLLVPERSGPLQLPPARFRGQGAGGFFDDFFGTDRNLSADGQAQTLQVRAQPDGAPQPWLPLRELRLRYLSAPSQARAGEAVEIAVEAVAQGATAAQFPEIPVPQVPGAQVFAERAETTERFVDGSPQLTVVRRFSVVPLQAGPLQVAGPRMDWWDTVAGRAQVATLPDLPLQVAAGAVSPAMPGPAAAAPLPATQAPLADDVVVATPVGGVPLLWLAVLFAVLWLATLGWVLWLRRRPRGIAGIGTQSLPGASAAPRPALAELRRALDADGFDAIVRLLQHMAAPPAADLDAVIARLEEAGQRAALEAMRRALWGGGGDVSAARARLRGAFREGPRWKSVDATTSAPLPPLYPR
jgi:hypothetical protein